MPRPTRALIDLDALRENYSLACRKARSTQTMAVVKADGYGHGLEQVVQALAPVAPMFAVASIEEAFRIRETGCRHTVLLLEGVHEAADLEECVRHDFLPAVHCAEQIRQLEQTSLSAPLPVWLKVNTGMNRLGVAMDAVPAMVSRLEALPGACLSGLMTHFACADAEDHPMTRSQLECIVRLRDQFPHLPVSAANSAAHFRGDDCIFDWTRPGIMLFGGAPLLECTGAELGLRPVMTLQSQLIAVREIEAGESVGYGATWVASQPTLMGIVAVGYGDGYPRHAPSGTPVAVRGRRAALIGRVSMDMLAVDLSNCPDAAVGDAVELWGGQISVDEVARLCGTISYELLTGVTPRVPRVYRGQEE
ncbi:alanine racemase [Marinobacteraceae bacterium S3BR75-40.1]